MRPNKYLAIVLAIPSLSLAQNVVVNPTTTQSIVQPVGTSLNDNIFNKIVYATPNYNWSQSPSGTLTGGTQATVTLTPCPAGLDTSDFSNAIYSVYISTVGTAEAAAVTGGTCTPGAASGTIIFTPVNSHAGGWTVGSASSGLQEAWNDGCGLNGALSIGYCTFNLLPAQSTTVPNYTVYAPVFLSTQDSRKTLFNGNEALILCETRSVCIFDGTRGVASISTDHTMQDVSFESGLTVDAVQVSDVKAASGAYTVHTANAHPFSMTANAGGPDYVNVNFFVNTGSNNGHIEGIFPITSVADNTHFTFSVGSRTFPDASGFGWAVLENAAVEDGGQANTYTRLQLRSPSGTTDLFSYGLVFDNDQAAEVDHFSDLFGTICLTSGSGFCGSTIYARGDQANASVLTIDHSNFGTQCAGNPVRGVSGNGITIQNSVAEGGPQWQLYLRNGLVGSSQINVYENSPSGCANPLYGSTVLPANGTAGTIVLGGHTQILGAGSYPLQGELPIFLQGGPPANTRNYFVVAHSSTGVSAILPIGQAVPTNGSTHVTVQWPNLALGDGAGLSVVEGAITWDILVTAGTSQIPLYGSGSWALTTGLSATCGTNGMCSYTDTQPSLSSYTVSSPTWFPALWWWPGGLVNSSATVSVDEVRGTTYVSTWGSNQIGLMASICQSPTGDSTGTSDTSPAGVQCLSTDPQINLSGGIATILSSTNQAGNTLSGVKGILNLGHTGGIVGGSGEDILTLNDSNYQKTFATQYFRPAADAADLAFGTDCNSSNGCMTLRAGQSLDTYINHLADGSSWLEQLNSTLKTFKVPITTNSQFTSTLATGTAPLSVTSSTPVSNLTLTAHPQVYEAGVLTTSEKIYTNKQALSSGSATHTFANSFSFTSSSTFGCSCTDQTAANACRAVPASATTVTLGGTGSDVLWLSCSGH